MPLSLDRTIIYPVLKMEKTLSYNYNYNNKTIPGLYGFMDQLFDPWLLI